MSGKSAGMNPFLRILIIAAMVGVTVFGLYKRFVRMSLMDTMTATATDATVVDVKDRHISKEHGYDTEYTYVVSYQDSDKIEHETESVAKSRNKKIHSRGETVDVKYDPRQADRGCVIVGDEHLMKGEGWKLGIGVVGLVAGIGLLTFVRLKKPQATQSEPVD